VPWSAPLINLAFPRRRQDVGVEKPGLVASDVDGTLLHPTDVITERTASVIERIVAAGTPFVLVSGRPPRWIPRVAAEAGVDGYAICGNGAVLYDIAADRVLGAHDLDPVLLNDLVNALDEALPGCRVATERIGERALSLDGREFATESDYADPWPGDTVHVAPRAEVLGHAANKLLVRHVGMTSDQLAEAARSLFGDVVDITFSSNVGLIEISPAGVTKGSGLAEVAERLGVPAERVVAFGDMPNDMSMLRWAGHGVAMANAHPDVLAVADEVTAPNSEDGVAQVLERWF
jgi:Cof subfamily protein (haloacid dehalogenase superfamily)